MHATGQDLSVQSKAYTVTWSNHTVVSVMPAQDKLVEV